MKHLLKIAIICLFITPLISNAGKKFSGFTAGNAGKSIAIVSLSANNYGGSLQGWNSANSYSLMGSRLNTMLTHTEEHLEKDWKVVKAESFVAKAEYQKLAGKQRKLGLPSFGKSIMPLMANNRKEMVKARLTKDKAVALTKITGTDFIMVIYSEWAVKTGKFVPTSKALTKNVISVYNKQGKQVFSGRKDQVGAKTLGFSGSVVVDENTINQWVDAYVAGINKLFPRKKSKTK